MSYSYDFALNDFDCVSRVDVSFIDSFAGARQVIRLVADASSGVVSWFRRDPAGGAWTSHAIPSVLSVHRHFGTTLDVDGNGFVDIVQPVFQGITWIRNLDGGRSWAAIPLVTFAQEAQQIIVPDVAVGDIDLDGRTTLVFVISTLATSPAAPWRGGLYWLRRAPGRWRRSGS